MNDMFLYRFGQKHGGGSDGGSGGGVFVVKIVDTCDYDNGYEDTITTDKTYAETANAFLAGVPVLFVHETRAKEDGVETVLSVRNYSDGFFAPGDECIWFYSECGTFNANEIKIDSM